jgi:hypothetical protein
MGSVVVLLAYHQLYGFRSIMTNQKIVKIGGFQRKTMTDTRDE